MTKMTKKRTVGEAKQSRGPGRQSSQRSADMQSLKVELARAARQNCRLADDLCDAFGP